MKPMRPKKSLAVLSFTAIFMLPAWTKPNGPVGFSAGAPVGGTPGSSWAWSVGDGPPPVSWSLEDFRFVWDMVAEHYPYLEWKGIDWERIRHDYRDRILSAAGRDVGGIIVDLLGELRDGHVYLEGPEARKYPFVPRRLRARNAFDPRLLERYLGDCPRRARRGSVYYGRTRGDLGYVLIPTFRPMEMTEDFSEAFLELDDTRGIILDVRNNGGGKGDRANEVVSWFLTKPLEKPPVYHEGRRLRFLPIQPKKTPYTNPVVVLVNGASFSEAERFAEIMKQIPTVQVVGETTGGGSAGGGDRFLLPNGQVFSFGTYDYRRYDGLPWESVGVEPDVVVPQTPAHVAAGRDRQLEVAMRLLG
jgi:hypothetical protein